MARPKLNGTGAFVWAFSIDKETHRMIKELSRSLGLNNDSAVVRMAVRRLYQEIKA
ncbi:ribbon-helix-helix domain-containing protein [Thermococcus aciditolerans]|uniref:hypothetical protein n=1 Tax=Thermococcus aciditolerans TaxID=2598455 RepID=UPI00143D0DB6|nr:hypothetical protein [Thermococcus aciditolerans]